MVLDLRDTLYITENRGFYLKKKKPLRNYILFKEFPHTIWFIFLNSLHIWFASILSQRLRTRLLNDSKSKFQEFPSFFFSWRTAIKFFPTDLNGLGLFWTFNATATEASSANIIGPYVKWFIEVISCNKERQTADTGQQAGQYTLQKDEKEEEEEEGEREEKKKGVQVYFQSIFSFWTSLGASTNSFPLKRMTAAVRALAMPQNTMYASVSVHVSPESERERGVLTSDNRHVYRQLTSDRSFSRVLGCWFKYARILWTVFFFFLPAISRHRMHMEKATSMMMGN